MARFKNCTVRVNKEKVVRLAKYKYGTISAFCEKLGVSRMRFYEVINSPHLSKESYALEKMSKALGVKVEYIL